MFESLVVSTQNRGTILLRQIDNQRHAKEFRKDRRTNRSLSRSAALSGSPSMREEN
jgi:hypothetical protein